MTGGDLADLARRVVALEELLAGVDRMDLLAALRVAAVFQRAAPADVDQVVKVVAVVERLRAGSPPDPGVR